MLLLASCLHQQVAEFSPQRDLTAEEIRIVEIARAAVESRITGEIEVGTPHRTDNGWMVDVWSLPKAPDGFVTVTIDDNDTVTQIF